MFVLARELDGKLLLEVAVLQNRVYQQLRVRGPGRLPHFHVHRDQPVDYRGLVIGVSVVILQQVAAQRVVCVHQQDARYEHPQNFAAGAQLAKAGAQENGEFLVGDQVQRVNARLERLRRSTEKILVFKQLNKNKKSETKTSLSNIYKN